MAGGSISSVSSSDSAKLRRAALNSVKVTQKMLYRFRWVAFLQFFRRVAVLVVVIRVVVAALVMAAHVVVSVLAPIRVPDLTPTLEVARLVLVHLLPRNLARMATIRADLRV
jgi:hypothetical protein